MIAAPESQSRFDLPAALLWASAFVLFGLLIVQASRLGTGSEALAGDSASTVGDLSALTLNDGDEKDVLLILAGSRNCSSTRSRALSGSTRRQ